MTGISTALWALVVIAVYCLPWSIALHREHPRAGIIALINLALGWTLIGWLLALVLATERFRPR